MRLPGTVRVGLFALCLGIAVFGLVSYWVNTRTLVPLDIPVTLAPGHIRASNIKINIETEFYVSVYSPPGGEQACYELSSLRTRWLTPVEGQAIPIHDTEGAIPGGVTPGDNLGAFQGEPGHYNLDIEVLSATQFLDSCHPRLQIAASYYEFSEWDSIQGSSLWFCMFCGLIGVAILLVFASTHSRKHFLEETRLRIFAADLPIGPAPPADLKRMRSFLVLMVLGILGMVAGVVVFAATEHWYKTRDFVPLDMPVPLSTGHIRTGDFTIQLKGSYFISIAMTHAFYNYNCKQDGLPKTHWVLTQNGRVVAHREHDEYPYASQEFIEGTDLFYFDAEPGTYNLDVEVLSDSKCLDVGKPRLRVFLSGYDRAEYDDLDTNLLLVSLVSFGVGLALLFASRSTGLRERPHALPFASSLPQQAAAWGITGLHYGRFLARRAWVTNPVTNLPTIAVLLSFTFFVWLAPMWIVFEYDHPSSHGLLVSIPPKGVPLVAASPGLTAPLVTIDANGRLYLNYKQTTWEELPAGLDQALRVLPVRVVYFEGDNSIRFSDAARAIDIIQSAGARAILLTPGSKAQN
jgi:biopolymer transport protein ExbD